MHPPKKRGWVENAKLVSNTETQMSYEELSTRIFFSIHCQFIVHLTDNENKKISSTRQWYFDICVDYLFLAFNISKTQWFSYFFLDKASTALLDIPVSEVSNSTKVSKVLWIVFSGTLKFLVFSSCLKVDIRLFNCNESLKHSNVTSLTT